MASKPKRTTTEANKDLEVIHVEDRSATDPDHVPSVLVDWVWHYGLVKGVGAMTLVGLQHTPLLDGRTAPDPIVVARLRFGISTAIELRDKLNQIILAADTSKPTETAH